MTARPLAELEKDPENPREITDEAAAGLAASMEECGDLSRITWNQQTGQLVAGHQRVDQLRAAGAIEWRHDGGEEGFIVDPRTGARFAVRVVDWPLEKQRLGNLLANNPLIHGVFTTAAFGLL
jgi:hypothetical protein